MSRHLPTVTLLLCALVAVAVARATPTAGAPGRQAQPRERQPPATERQAEPREGERAPAERQAEPREPPKDEARRRSDRPPGSHPEHRPPTAVVRGRVFVGGYFYDPVFGRYPWWPPASYPYWYAPVLEARAELRLRVTPRDAAVFVDGFYAGIVDDFDGVFQRLPLTPGGHHITLYLEGFQTTSRNIYLRPASTFTVHENLIRLPPGRRSTPPYLAPPVPPPPAGSYDVPRALPYPPPRSESILPAGGPGALDLYVQPSVAVVRIDGQPWVSSEPGHFLVHLAAGRHVIEIAAPGYLPYVTDLDITDGETPLNVSLMRAP